MSRLIYVLFFVSGACGLIYQIVWSRILTHIFGSTVLAVGAVLAAFMSGMALGSLFLGPRGDRTPNPLRLYAYYEIAIGVTALGVLLAMDRLTTLYVGIHDWLGHDTVVLAIARFVVAFVLVLIPTLLMGATLPVLSRFVVRSLSRVGARLSALYAINTVGAVAGSLAAGFYLIGTLGIHRTVYVAVACNIGVGLVAWFASMIPAAATSGCIEDRESSDPDPAAGSPSPRGYAVLLWAFAISGFTSFVYEVFWSRSLVFLLGNSTYAFTLMLTAFLSGIALGGFAIRFVVDRVRNPMRLFACLQISIACVSAGSLPLLFAIVESQSLGAVLSRTGGDLVSFAVSRFGTALLLMLVPATMFGATFPLVGRICVRDLRRTSSEVGKIYAVNTIGNVVGALAPGLVLLPVLGIQKGILFTAVLNLSVGVFLLVYSEVRHARWKIALLIGIVCAGLALTRIPLRFQFPSQYQNPGDHVSFYDEGVLATTKVFMNPDTGEKLMSIDGIVIGGTTITDYKQQILAHLPKLLLKEYETELSVGLGSGILLGESARYPKLETVVCVEIEPGVVDGAEQFAAEHGDVLNDAKVEVVVDDVGNYLRTTDRRFDIISADEKTAEEYASNGFSYSAEYYALLADRLNPDGLAIQWIPGDLPYESFLMVLRTFTGAFPHASVWFFPPIGKRGLTNVFVVGSLKEIEIDRAWMQTVIEDHRSEPGGLQKYGLTTADAVLAHYVSSDAVLRRAIPDGPTNSLEYPRYEFYSPRDFAAPISQRVLRILDFLVPQRESAEAEFLAAASTGTDPDHLGTAREAEDFYLAGFRRRLTGSSLAEIEQFYDQAVELAPWNGNLRLQVVRLYWNAAGRRYLQGDARGALDLMRKAVHVDPGNGEIRYYFGLALWQTGDVDRAIEQMEDAIARNPRLLQPHRGLATLHLQRGEFEAAARHLEAILAIHPDDVFSLAAYGIHLAEREDRLDEATTLIERAYGIAPKDAAVIDGRAWLTYLRGDRATARRIVKRGGDYFEANPGFARRRSVILRTGLDAAGH